MKIMRYTAILVLACIISLCQTADSGKVLARGGGGGFHGGGGAGRSDFSGGSGFRGERDNSGFGRNYSDGGSFGRDDNFMNTPRPSEQNLRQSANTSYNWGNGQHALSTDGGFAAAASRGSFGGGAVASRASTVRMSPADMVARGQDVRSAYNYPRYFDRHWWDTHRGAWYYGWGDTWAWDTVGWSDLANWWDVPVDTAPVYYDYGDNITYQDNTVYYGTQPVESASVYYNQAQTLAQSTPASAVAGGSASSQASSWKPLGVFSLVQGAQTSTTMMFQLAVNKSGAIRGNYYNPLTNEVKMVKGAVDKHNMRAAWIIGNDKSVVYDTGLANLLQDQGSILVHYGKDRTQQWTLIRIKQPTAAS